MSIYIISYVVPLQTHKAVEVNDDFKKYTLNCMAYGASRYFWERENGTISSNAEGINTSSLLLHNVSPSDSGNYTCTAEYRSGYIHSSFFIITFKGTAN